LALRVRIAEGSGVRGGAGQEPMLPAVTRGRMDDRRHINLSSWLARKTRF
jgi:hypothetical protein